MPSLKQDLVDQVMQECRRQSGSTVAFHQLIADRLQLNVTDHKCADVLLRYGSMTAGELAQRSHLTSGAITGVVDRLERRQLVQRVFDPADRRKVIIEPRVANLLALMGPLFEGLRQGMDALCQSMSTTELQTVLRFLRSTNALVDSAAAGLVAPPANPSTAEAAETTSPRKQRRRTP